MRNSMSIDFDEDDNLILLDSWGSHKDEESLKNQTSKEFEVLVIPKCTTKYIQPCDVYLFRQYKVLGRRITEFTRKFYFENESVKPHNRIFILRMQSIIFNQLSAPAFQPTLKYSWMKSGYSDRVDGYEFKNVNEICFKDLKDCDSPNCEIIAFIKYAHCKKFFCFEDFIITNFHYHHL